MENLIIGIIFLVIGGAVGLLGVTTDSKGMTIVGVLLLVVGNVLIWIEPQPERVIDLPEELPIAKQGELLRVERVTKDSIVLGFTSFEPEYKLELIDQKYVAISNGKEIKIVLFDSIQSYITKDNE